MLYMGYETSVLTKKGIAMKIKTENIDFECPCCKDPYSQCPFFTCETKEEKTNRKTYMDWKVCLDFYSECLVAILIIIGSLLLIFTP